MARTLSHTSRDFATIRAELEAYVREVGPDFWTDFYATNLGSVLIDLAALVGDSISYSQDALAQELFLSTARRYETGLRFARSVGYSPRAAVAATVTLTARDIPASVIAVGGTIAAGSSLRGANGKSYELLNTYTIPAGASYLKVVLVEGVTYPVTQNEFAPSSKPYQVLTLPVAIVAEKSWKVYVGTVTPNNLWTQVDNVDLEIGATNTYSASLDERGRLQLRFGDNASGKIPDQTIRVEYRTTSGEGGNAPASTITGSLPVNLTGGGTVSVEFSNTDEPDNSQSEYSVTYETVGSTVSGATQSGSLVYSPVVVGSMELTFSLPGSYGTIVVKDNGAGAFVIVSAPSGGGYGISASTIGYAVGSWSVTFSGWSGVLAGGAITANYKALQTANIAGILSGAASGGKDRESLEEMRRNIPAYLSSQRRVVTLTDYEVVAKQVAGVALVAADRLQTSYRGNYVRVAVWAHETTTFTSRSPDGVSSAVPYTRYLKASAGLLNSVAGALLPRTLVTLTNTMSAPDILWCDIYLQNVSYDLSLDAADVHAAVTKAVVGVFEDSDGFSLRLADLTKAVSSVNGVKYFTLQRVATGTQGYSSEAQPPTAASTNLSGVLARNFTLERSVIVPGSVTIVVDQPSGNITVVDDGQGQLVVSVGSRAISSSSIDYNTGAWSLIFSGSALSSSRPVIASYQDVIRDYRATQISEIDGATAADEFPPPGITLSGAVVTPPYYDGRPEKVLRSCVDVTGTVPYLAGDETRYAKLQDIVAATAAGATRFYNGQYYFNNEILYDAVFGVESSVRAINLRKLSFNLIPV